MVCRKRTSLKLFGALVVAGSLLFASCSSTQVTALTEEIDSQNKMIEKLEIEKDELEIERAGLKGEIDSLNEKIAKN